MKKTCLFGQRIQDGTQRGYLGTISAKHLTLHKVTGRTNEDIPGRAGVLPGSVANIWVLLVRARVG